MWVKFTANFYFKPRPPVTRAYRAGQVVNVTRACAEKAITAGKAVAMTKRARGSVPGEANDGATS